MSAHSPKSQDEVCGAAKSPLEPQQAVGNGGTEQARCDVESMQGEKIVRCLRMMMIIGGIRLADIMGTRQALGLRDLKCEFWSTCASLYNGLEAHQRELTSEVLPSPALYWFCPHSSKEREGRTGNAGARTRPLI